MSLAAQGSLLVFGFLFFRGGVEATEHSKKPAAALQPAMQELIRQAAQGEVLHNDDTSMPVLALRRKHALATEEEQNDPTERTGVFTSGIVSTAQKQTIALFFTGRRHAGENLAEVLQRRAAELTPPMQM